MRDIVFVGEYSFENSTLAQELCEDDEYSFGVFWKTPYLLQTKNDFMTVLDSNTRFNDMSYIIPYQPETPAFVLHLSKILSEAIFNTHLIFTRGSIYQILPLALIKHKIDPMMRIVAILENGSSDLKDFEKFTLEQCDMIFSMGPSANIPGYEDKTVRVFEKFESSFYKYNPSVPSDPECVLIICNNETFKSVSEDKRSKGFSIINVESPKFDNRELCVYASLSGTVVDATGDEELRRILKKLNKKTVPIEEFRWQVSNSKKVDIIESLDGKYAKEFCSELKKLISKDISAVKPPTIIGAEITHTAILEDK